MMICEMATIFRACRKIEIIDDVINPGDRPRCRMKWVLATTFLLTTSVSLLAEEVSTNLVAMTGEDEQWLGELMQVLDESTEIATKNRLNADYVPGTVTVLQGRDLEALGMRTVWDALALIPDVMINQGNRGNLLVATRGFSAPFNSGNIKVLLNSVPMSRDNSGLSSQALSLPIEQVDRIEFIRGPSAVLYGDYAYHGVLNILTRKENNRIFARMDEHGTTTLGGQYAYRSEDEATRFSLNAAGLTGNSVEAPVGIHAQDDQPSGIAIFAHQGFQLTAQAIHRDYQNDQGVDYNERTEAFEARQAFELAANTVVNLYGSYLGNDFNTRRQHFLGHTWEGRAELSWQGMEHHRWLAQFSYTGTRIEEAFKAPPSRPSNNPQPPAVNQSDVNWRYYGISLQDQYEVSNRLSVTVGLRFDHRDDLDLNLFTPRLAAVWRLSDTHILKAQYSKGYRAPTFWELFPNNTQIDLKPETVATTELSYINRVTDRVLRLTLFNSQLEDHISPLGAPSFDFGNVGSSRTAGVELEWEQQWSPQLKSWFNLSYSDSRDGRVPSSNEATNDQDPGTTNWLGNLALFYRPTDRVLFTAYWNYIGERHAESVNSTAEHRVAVTLSLLNIWTKGLTLRLGVRNLLQADQRSLISEPTNVQVTDFPDSLVWGQISYDF
ncbi:MAG TPA: TonB-dependent receptor [Candidatus Competibacter sp.]|nr:TonB-dependent receptor [Candidatus Competibacteraceae bacterium]HPE73124.1 TonB-dependent receptor [Candidatus Competibacter sp.]